MFGKPPAAGSADPARAVMMMVGRDELPWSEACERNRVPIARVLDELLPQQPQVLEIGSGTGQHAVFFARLRPELVWHCSDLPANLAGLQARIDREGDGRLPDAIELDVMRSDWPCGPFDLVFSANTLHIMPWAHTPVLLERSCAVLANGGCLVIYGPFHDNGVHDAPSNAAFDRSLKSRDPAMGVRDAQRIRALASAIGMQPEADLALPANNRILVFRKPDRAPN